MKKPEINHEVVVVLATSQNSSQLLDTFIITYPKEIQEQLRIEYSTAIQEYLNSKPVKLEITQDLGRYSQSEVTKKADVKELQLLKCPTCGAMHFRHAGYVLPLLPYEEKQAAKVGGIAQPVYVCVKDRTSFIHYDSQIQIVSDFIDLEAWEKFEKKVNKAVGPGGNC